MTDRQRALVIALLVAGTALAFVLRGGNTIAILNRTSRDICEVNFSYRPDEDGWGRNRLGGRIPPGQSRDVQLPLYFGWLEPTRASGFMGRVADCDGEEIEVVFGISEKLHIWEVR
ncbi:MAG: hypothetical protein HYZ26_10635 [Chloroflexi bacterium]|nr:hypothetical protein [Chloroflexota bacterium]